MGQFKWERPSPTSWRRRGWEASHLSRWTGTCREVQICRKRDKERDEVDGPMPGAEDDWKSQESLWCQVFLSPFPNSPPTPTPTPALLNVYPGILSLGHHIYLEGFSRPEKVR